MDMGQVDERQDSYMIRMLLSNKEAPVGKRKFHFKVTRGGVVWGVEVIAKTEENAHRRAVLSVFDSSKPFLMDGNLRAQLDKVFKKNAHKVTLTTEEFFKKHIIDG